VFARTYFPAWRARVDGAPARVLVANARDVAVALPAGRHVFEIAWDRRPFHRGVVAQGAALAAALVVALATHRRKDPGDGLTP
jgi:type IV secretory pathway TrbF-like protein